MQKISENEHQQLAVWAAECAARVLPVFEMDCPGDQRPREAIEAARSWIRGDLKMTDARKFAFAAHDAARSTTHKPAIAAARSAGHAAATAHVHTHAKYAAEYALKAVEDKIAEREWQVKRYFEITGSIYLDNA